MYRYDHRGYKVLLGMDPLSFWSYACSGNILAPNHGSMTRLLFSSVSSSYASAPLPVQSLERF